MKTTFTKFVAVFSMLLFAFSSFAQSPQAFNYQAVARDASGNVLQTQLLGIKVSLHKGSESGLVSYSETFTPTTNEFGLFTLEIGKGTVVSGEFDTIAWQKNQYWLQVEMDPLGSSTYANMGTSQLLSVPYAMFAANADIKGDSNYIPKYQPMGGLINSSIYENKNGNIGVGTMAPTADLHIDGNTRLTGAFYDMSNYAGNEGDILTSTGAATKWANTRISFSAYAITYTHIPAASNTYITLNKELFDDGNNYDTINNQFVVPSAGLYHFDAHVMLNAASSAGSNTRIELYVNGVSKKVSASQTSSGVFGINISADMKLVAGDIVKVVVYSVLDIYSISTESSTWFTGHKVY